MRRFAVLIEARSCRSCAKNIRITMKVELNRLNEAVHFECVNEDGLTVHVDGSPEIGGEGKGPRPMQLLLMSHAACSSLDVVTLLRKMRQPLEDIKVTATADRDATHVPPYFRKINLHFWLKGDIAREMAEKAIRLSVEKYCSVGFMLSKTTEITWSLTMEE